MGRLTMKGMEISVVYFRAGYSPNDFPTQAECVTLGLVPLLISSGGTLAFSWSGVLPSSALLQHTR